MNPPAPVGAAERRGPLRAGDRVQLTDPKGRHHTIELVTGKTFHTHRGQFHHDELIGKPEGTVVRNTAGVDYVVLRPLLSDFVLSMARGAAVIYPKDSAQIIQFADVYPGARVMEAGVGSGGLTMSLLRAVGDDGELTSVERREDFADIARANVESFFGGRAPRMEAVARRLRRAGDGARAWFCRSRDPRHARAVGEPRRRRACPRAWRRVPRLRGDGDPTVPSRGGTEGDG